MNCDKIGNCDQCPRWFDEGKDFCKCCGFDLNSYNQPEEKEEEEECICESDKKPNPLCPDHQCCWACSTQSVPITLNEERGLWLCGGCNDKGDSCPRIDAERIRRFREKSRLDMLLCVCGCKGRCCVSCGAHVQQRDQYVMVERKYIHCLWCYKDRKKNKVYKKIPNDIL